MRQNQTMKHLKNIVGQKEFVAQAAEWLANKKNAYSLMLRGKSGVGKSFFADNFAMEYEEKGFRVITIERPEDMPGKFDEIFECVQDGNKYVIVCHEWHLYAKGDKATAASKKLVAFWASLFENNSKTCATIVKPGNKAEAVGYKGIFILTSFAQKVSAANRNGGDHERRQIEWNLADYSIHDLRTIAARRGFEKGEMLTSLLKACRGTASLLEKMEKVKGCEGFAAISDPKEFLSAVKLCGFYPSGLTPPECDVMRAAYRGEKFRRKLVCVSRLDVKAFGEASLYMESQGLIFDDMRTIVLTPKGEAWCAMVFGEDAD